MKRARLSDGTLDDADLMRLARDRAVPIELVPEPTLDEVADEDKPLIQSIILAMQAVRHPEKLFRSWSVVIDPSGYLVTGMLPTDFELNLSDLELLQAVNPLRITSVRVVQSNGSNQVKL